MLGLMLLSCCWCHVACCQFRMCCSSADLQRAWQKPNVYRVQ
jgi:hypothetical protein